jgi:hypothetical protein
MRAGTLKVQYLSWMRTGVTEHCPVMEVAVSHLPSKVIIERDGRHAASGGDLLAMLKAGCIF